MAIVFPGASQPFPPLFRPVRGVSLCGDMCFHVTLCFCMELFGLMPLARVSSFPPPFVFPGLEISLNFWTNLFPRGCVLIPVC